MKNIKHLRQAVKANPLDADGHCALANLLTDHVDKQKGATDKQVKSYYKDLGEAISHYETALKINPIYTEARYGFAKAREKRGDTEIAICYFKKVLELDPKHKQADREIKRLEQKVYEQQKRFITDCKQRIKHDRKDAMAYRVLASLYEGSGKYNRSMECLQKALELEPKDEQHYYFLAFGYKIKADKLTSQKFRQPNYQQAIGCFKKYIVMAGCEDENFASVHQYIAECYCGKKDYVNAIRWYKKSLKIEPNHQYCIYLIAVSYELKKDVENAIIYYNKAIAAPDYNNFSAILYCELGQLYVREKNYQKAKQCFETAVKKDSGNDKSFFGLGYCNFEMGDDQMAEVAYQMAIQANYYNHAAHNNLGNIYKKKTDHKKAIQYYMQAVQIKPHFYEPYYNLAMTYRELKDYETALMWLRRFAGKKR